MKEPKAGTLAESMAALKNILSPGYTSARHGRYKHCDANAAFTNKQKQHRKAKNMMARRSRRVFKLRRRR